MVDANCQDSLKLLLEGATREGIDAGTRKADAWNVFAQTFNGDATYSHPNEEEEVSSHMDPNSPSSRERTGLKLRDVYRSIRANMNKVTAEYTASGNGGQNPFWSFCNGKAILLYHHLAWGDKPFYGAIVRLAPGRIESGLSPVTPQKRPLPSLDSPSSSVSEGDSSVYALEIAYPQKKMKLADTQIKSAKLTILGEKIEKLTTLKSQCTENSELYTSVNSTLKTF
jgi:hypothetical protein